MTRALLLIGAALLAACGSTPPPPDWQMNARGALERGLWAHLDGNDRVASLEFGRLRSEVSRTGRADLMARAELARCAALLAALATGPCEAFEALRADAAPPERAYAGYLRGQVDAAGAALLPDAHRALGQALAARDGADLAPRVAAIADPLARLVAAGAVLQAGRASPALLQAAVDTASAQGWRRALLAWLEASAQAAEAGGDAATAARLRQRSALVTREGRP